MSRSAKNLQHDLYCHPGVQWDYDQPTKPGIYKREYDVFSLGMVLLEIGLWKQLHTLRKGSTSSTTTNPIEFVRHMQKDWVPKLEYKCGKIYCAVVRQCLTIDTGHGANGGTESMDVDGESQRECFEWEEKRKKEQTRFYWKVVKELEKCNA
jgi:hypothetical protein